MSVRLEMNGPVARLLLDRPAKRNALDEGMLQGILAAASRVPQSEARVLIVMSTSPYFSAGADLNDWAQPTQARAAELSALGNEAFDAIARLPITSVAAIEGVAAGGGLELALACDLRLTTSTALLGLPESTLGNLPSWGALPRLVRTVGQARARELLLTGELISGHRAAELGLVNWVSTPEQFQDELQRIVANVLKTEPTAVSLVKTLLGPDPQAGLESVLAAYTSQLDSSRQRKQAFLDNRNQAAAEKTKNEARA